MTGPESTVDQIGVPTFIGSFADGPDQVLIVLRGDLDRAAVDRLVLHLDGVHAAGTRFVVLDAAAVTHCDPTFLDLLGRTQRQLARQHGLLTVRGLRPHLLFRAPPPAESERPITFRVPATAAGGADPQQPT